MMLHKLQFDDFDEPVFQAFAIQTTIEPYRLSFFLNEKLQIHLKPNDKGFEAVFKKEIRTFTGYSYHNEDTDEIFDLVKNSQTFIETLKPTANSLFGESIEYRTAKMYLVPEFKKADYILRIENAAQAPEEIAEKIKTITTTTFVQLLNVNELKSKNNLIFY
jgi:hypothetical protein